MTGENMWSASALVAVAGQECRSPAAAAVGGRLHAVWESGRVLYHAFLDGHDWTEPVRVAGGEEPALAAAPDGTLHCLFSNRILGNREIFYARWTGAGWTLPETVSRTSGVSTQPALVAAPDGSLHGVWTDTTPGYSVIYYGRRMEPAWSSAPVPNARGSNPSVAVTPNGDVYVAWQSRTVPRDHYEVLCAMRCEGSWGMAELVSDNPEHHCLYPRLAANAGGACHLVWQEERDGVFAIRHADRRPNEWCMPQDISDPTADSRLAQICANRQGLFQAIWVEGRDVWHRVRSPEFDSAWWDPETAGKSCQEVSDLAAALVPETGELHLIWCAFTGMESRSLFHVKRKSVFGHAIFMPVIGR